MVLFTTVGKLMVLFTVANLPNDSNEEIIIKCMGIFNSTFNYVYLTVFVQFLMGNFIDELGL